MADQWTRPASVPMPKVWKRCIGRKPMLDGKIPRFRIEDVTLDMHPEIVDFMTKHHLDSKTGSVMMKTLRMYEDPASIEEFRSRWQRALHQNISIVAFLEDEEGKPRIAGANVLKVVRKTDNEPLEKIQSPKIRAVVRDLGYTGNQVDVFEKYGVDKYITALGLTLNPEFRGQGLGLEMLTTRFDIAREVGVPLAYTVFSGYPSQVLAKKAGYELLAEVPYESFKEDGKLVYPGIDCKSLMAMAKKI